MKKNIFTAAIVLGLVCCLGCGGKAENAAGSGQEPVTAESKTEEIAENPTEKPVQETPEPAPTKEPAPKMEDLYDYLLYKEGSKENPVMGFNYPYKAYDYYEGYEYDISSGKAFVSAYQFGGYIEGVKDEMLNCSLFITSDVDYDYGEKDYQGIKVNREEIDKIDTIYGTAKLNFVTIERDLQGQNFIYYYEEAQIGTKATISLGGDSEVYQGVIERLLPILFEPKAVSYENKFLPIRNRISVANVWDYYIGDDGKKVFGFNDEEHSWNIRDAAVVNEVYKELVMWRSNEYKNYEEIRISVNGVSYTYFFGGRSGVELEKMSEVETPFGKAEIFSALRKELEEPVREEVAILNNMGQNIVINYYNGTDNGYEGKLEEIIPTFFE